jgi:hypothetical protein
LKCQLILLLDIFHQAAFVEVLASQFLYQLSLFVVNLYPCLQIVLGVLNSRSMRIAPSCKRGHDEVSNALGDSPVALRGLVHLCSHSIVCLNPVSCWPSASLDLLNLSNTGTIVAIEATLDLVCSSPNLAQAHPIYVFCFSSHPRDGKNLFILRDALLKLAKEYAEACGQLERSD